MSDFYKSTVVIYSRYDGTTVELSTLARDAEEGDSICTGFRSEPVSKTDLPNEAANFFEVAQS